MTAVSAHFTEHYISARDGLRLYLRHYPAVQSSDGSHQSSRPVLCLAGLTRNSRDFGLIAEALSAHPTSPRDVYTLDMRGRGNSEHDADWKAYAIPNEMHDVIDVMTVLGLYNAGIIGTSRGGLITMILSAAQPGRIGAVVLNDIGPVIEQDGLARIAGYVGRIPTPKTWTEASSIVRDLTKRDFPTLSDSDLDAFARQLFNERNGRPISGYDSKLAKALSVLDGPIPVLWPQFESLKRVPLMVVRGGNSDLLSEKTVDEMQRRHPNFTRLTVPNEGHAPLLRDRASIDAVADFFQRADAHYGQAHASAA